MGTLRGLDNATGKFASLATSMEPTVKALPVLLNDTGIALKRADMLLANINQKLDSFERAAQGMERAAQGAEQFSVSGAALSDAMMAESVPRLNVLLDDVQRSSRGLERLLNEINEQPASLIFGRNPMPPGPGEPGFGSQRGTR